MNPPAALLGAMSRERKPFTYTPGGLDLSEIKSERMAKRLMRNAMNQGVPEQPQTVQSPTTPSTPIAVPNYNCLPVQVFPAFNLPANPKSLLRTRSTPDQHREQPAHTPPQNINSLRRNGAEQLTDIMNNNLQQHAQTIGNNTNNNKPVTAYDRNTAPSINSDSSRTMYGSDSYTAPILPEISYDAEYFHAIPKVDDTTGTSTNYFSMPKENEKSAILDTTLESVNKDITIEPIAESISVPIIETKPAEDNAGTDDDEKREVKVVKKQQVKKESKVETQNGDHNGDVNTDADMTVTIPSKKSAAKTETKVEVSTKTLPDGSTEETKVTTTRTTIDGRTEIKTKTERKIIPKALEIEVEEEEEEEEENGDVVVKEVDDDDAEETKKVVKKQDTPVTKQNDNVVKREERSESTTTTKKVVVVQQSTKTEAAEESEEEEEEEEVEEEVKPAENRQPATKNEPKEEDEEEEEEVEEEIIKEKKAEAKTQEAEEEEEEEEEEVTEVKKSVTSSESKKEEEEEEEEEYEETEESQKNPEPKVEKQPEIVKESQNKKEEDEESEYTEEEYESETEETKQKAEESKPTEEQKPKPEDVKEENKEQSAPQTETKIPLREPSIPLEKVEDVEIKPIGLQTISKTHTESTEIVTNASDKPAGMQSTQTEYNRIENIVTVNRTTKTLDHTYEQLTQQGIPTVKTYFAPEREKVSTSPQPAKPYQPAYHPPSQPERRHSLLLERISMDRQMPSEIYQNINNQSYEPQRQWSQEPQSEVVNVSNVKPSTITNQEWFQQSRKENIIYNNVLPSAAAAPSQQQWSQPQPQRQPQQSSQSYAQPQPQPQPQSYAQPQPQSYSQPQPQPQYQPSYVDNNLQNTSKFTSNTYQQNTYTDYSSQPSSWAPNYGTSLPSVNAPSNQYSYLNKDSSDSYQQYSSSYVPPPWEQDPNYVAPELPTQNYYQPPPSNTFSPGGQPAWKPAPPSNKFTKPPPTAYIPPAPNQSFVKPANTAAPPKMPGRKTYYSEYERRYISVPESTYIPGETKYQPQPDPSPQYYYDNNEPSEKVEHQWRKELREFTEKSTQQTDQSCVKPPWEDEAKYAKAQAYQPTPSWSQTLKPQTWRERSFESEYVGSKTTQTLGRGRPLSSYGASNVEPALPERARGVSVDRYNPSSYQAPLAAEHAPVQTHVHNPQAKTYHNPNVPAYHSRASAEPREQPVPIPQARHWADSRATPIQSRSFKYLQWITGTED